MTAIETLTAEVNETKGVIQSAITLIQGLAQAIRDNAGNPAALTALAADLDAQQALLSAAITANPIPGTVIPPVDGGGV